LGRGTPVAFAPGNAWRNRVVHKEEEMAYLVSLVSSLRRDDAQDLLEYALLVALIALIAIAAVTAAGVKVNDIFNAMAAAIPA
jgi:Flp pilus assembly pilin Flp